MSFLSIFSSLSSWITPKTLDMMSLGGDALHVAEAIEAGDPHGTAANFLTLLNDISKLGKVKELSAERLAKYRQGTDLILSALFEDIDIKP